MMTNKSPLFTCSAATLAHAWSESYLAIKEPPRRDFTPFLISIGAGPTGDVTEDQDLKHALDACLENAGLKPVETVAKTIFPQAMWARAKGDRHKFYASYLESLPDFVAMAPECNKYGLYFARLIGFGIDHRTGDSLDYMKGKLREDGNQLEFIIKACKPGAQRMALQATVFDPMRDQGENRRPFPCLQHVTFIPDFERKTLTVNAFYALQLFFAKAYGNWLGLSRLGAFVASQTGLRFDRLNSYAGVQKAPGTPKDSVLWDRLMDLARLQCSTATDSSSAKAAG